GTFGVAHCGRVGVVKNQCLAAFIMDKILRIDFTYEPTILLKLTPLVQYYYYFFGSSSEKLADPRQGAFASCAKKREREKKKQDRY
ncbi:hypothetical protein ACJX0J_016575, partial [Zea mays]